MDTNSNAADFTLAAAITPTNAGGTAPDPDPTPDPDPEPDPGSGHAHHRRDPGHRNGQPLVGTTVTTRGKVTAAFPTGGLNGYYLQTPGTGGDLNAHQPRGLGRYLRLLPRHRGRVQIGDYVEVTGVVAEYYGMTQVNVTAAAGLTKLTEAAPEVKATAFTLPATRDLPRIPRRHAPGPAGSPHGD